jgi:ferredoxin
MTKLKVEYYRNKCVGQGNCAAIARNYFELSGKKASLKNSHKNSDEIYSAELDCDDATLTSLIRAGKSCPVNAIRITDMDKNEDIVGVKISEDRLREVAAEYDDSKEFVIDPEGYFLIRLDREKGNIEVGFCNERNKLVLKVTGKKPIDIYQTIINKANLNIRKDHAAYLGRELHNAYIALKHNLKYVQDDETDFGHHEKAQSE